MDRGGRDRRGKAASATSDFLCYCDRGGIFADFDSMRHLFITNLASAGRSPNMPQTLARRSDIQLILGVCTHVGLHDHLAAIAMLPGPPAGKGNDYCQEQRLARW